MHVPFSVRFSDVPAILCVVRGDNCQSIQQIGKWAKTFKTLAAHWQFGRHYLYQFVITGKVRVPNVQMVWAVTTSIWDADCATNGATGAIAFCKPTDDVSWCILAQSKPWPWNVLTEPRIQSVWVEKHWETRRNMEKKQPNGTRIVLFNSCAPVPEFVTGNPLSSMACSGTASSSLSSFPWAEGDILFIFVHVFQYYLKPSWNQIRPLTCSAMRGGESVWRTNRNMSPWRHLTEQYWTSQADAGP